MSRGKTQAPWGVGRYHLRSGSNGETYCAPPDTPQAGTTENRDKFISDDDLKSSGPVCLDADGQVAGSMPVTGPRVAMLGSQINPVLVDPMMAFGSMTGKD